MQFAQYSVSLGGIRYILFQIRSLLGSRCAEIVNETSSFYITPCERKEPRQTNGNCN